MTQRQVLKNLEDSLRENPCQGPPTGLEERCHQVTCKKCNMINQIKYLNANDTSPPSIKDKLTATPAFLKNKMLGAITWFNAKRKRTTEEVMHELKKLGYHLK